MREAHSYGVLVITHRNQPEAVVLSVERYQALLCLAQRGKVRDALDLAELRALFDRRLASLNGSQANQALTAFMNVQK
jgi:PHD/YefM family antitoxin component YafN of YafNO toxin-antitoxin module